LPFAVKTGKKQETSPRGRKKTMNLKIKDFLIDRDTLMIEKLTNGEQTADGKFAPKNKIGNRFKKGESGNQKGRPKLTRLTDALREQLAEINPDAPEETIAEEIAKTLIKLAISGDIAAIRECFDRSEGKSPINLDVGNKDGEPMLITFSFNNSNARLITDGE
jgi:hypothetical protein